MSYYCHYFHLITSTHNRKPTILEGSKRIMWKYIHELCKSNGWKIIRINGYLDHMHILISLPGTVTPEFVMRIIKSRTTQIFRHSKYFPNFEGWGEGFASFTVSESDTDNVKNYIMNQTEHHQQNSIVEKMEIKPVNL